MASFRGISSSLFFAHAGRKHPAHTAAIRCFHARIYEHHAKARSSCTHTYTHLLNELAFAGSRERGEWAHNNTHRKHATNAFSVFLSRMWLLALLCCCLSCCFACCRCCVLLPLMSLPSSSSSLFCFCSHSALIASAVLPWFSQEEEEEEEGDAGLLLLFLFLSPLSPLFLLSPLSSLSSLSSGSDVDKRSIRNSQGRIGKEKDREEEGQKRERKRDAQWAVKDIISNKKVCSPLLKIFSKPFSSFGRDLFYFVPKDAFFGKQRLLRRI